MKSTTFGMRPLLCHTAFMDSSQGRVRRFGCPPGEICRIAALDRQHEEFRKVVGMRRTDTSLYFVETVANRFDDDLALLVAVERTLPAVHRHHRRENIDAGGETRLHQRGADLLANVG